MTHPLTALDAYVTSYITILNRILRQHRRIIYHSAYSSTPGSNAPLKKQVA